MRDDLGMIRSFLLNGETLGDHFATTRPERVGEAAKQRALISVAVLYMAGERIFYASGSKTQSPSADAFSFRLAMAFLDPPRGFSRTSNWPQGEDGRPCASLAQGSRQAGLHTKVGHRIKLVPQPELDALMEEPGLKERAFALYDEMLNRWAPFALQQRE